MDFGPIGERSPTFQRDVGRWKEQDFELRIIELVGQRPRETGRLGAAKVIPYGANPDLAADGDLAVAQTAFALEPQYFFDPLRAVWLTHGQYLPWHRVLRGVVTTDSAEPIVDRPASLFRCSVCSGIGVHFPSESVFGLRRNIHTDCIDLPWKAKSQ
jgi:hypothetical protein